MSYEMRMKGGGTIMETHTVTSLQRMRCAIGFARWLVQYCPGKACMDLLSATIRRPIGYVRVYTTAGSAEAHPVHSGV